MEVKSFLYLVKMPIMSCSRGENVDASRSQRILQAVKALKAKNLSQEACEMIVVVKREQGSIIMK